jgi:hypothetical protein
VTVTATPPDAPPRGGACASAHGVGAAATRAAFAASSPERVSSPSAASAIFASPPPTPSSAASGGVSHVASAPETTRAGADAVGFPFPLAPVPGDEKTHRSGGDAATPTETFGGPDPEKRFARERRDGAALDAGVRVARGDARDARRGESRENHLVGRPDARGGHGRRRHAGDAHGGEDAGRAGVQDRRRSARDARRERRRNFEVPRTFAIRPERFSRVFFLSLLGVAAGVSVEPRAGDVQPSSGRARRRGGNQRVDPRGGDHRKEIPRRSIARDVARRH